MRQTASLSTAAQQILNEVDTVVPSDPSVYAPFPFEDIHRVGDIASIGLGETWWPSDLMIKLLEFVHVSSGLLWWGSIALLTVMLRVGLFPLALKSARNVAIIPYIKDKQLVLMEEAKNARASGELVKVQAVTTKLFGLYREWGYSPFLFGLGLIQIPFFFAMFRAMTHCSDFPVPGWDTGGTLWFENLTAVDPYLLLPVISGVTTSVTILVSLHLTD